MDRQQRINLQYFLVAVLVIVVVQAIYTATMAVERIDYSRFEQLLDNGQIESVAVSEERIQGTLAEPLEDGGPTRFETTRVEPDFAQALAEHDVTYDGRVETDFWSNLLSWLLPIGLLIGFWWFMIRRMAQNQGGMGQLMQIGKSKAKIYMEKKTGVGFDTIAGVDEAKHELEETVSFLKDPDRYGRLGARQPKGILLVGPPGTGKTLLARAVAGEAGVPFFSISGSEFVEMFVGVGAARVRDLFEQAREQAPCIIFVDELDALGRARGGGPGGGAGGGNDEKEQTLNQLLGEMDGFDSRSGIVILAATNQPQVLDSALLRAGRFDRQVLVDRPDKKGRLAILKVHAGNIVVGDDVDFDEIAQLTAGFSGADLANLVNEAAILATRRDAAAVGQEDFTGAVERIVAGLEKKSRVLGDTERRTVAHHEMGHALVARLLPGAEALHKVSIIPRGVGALGYTMQRPTEDRFLMSEPELRNRLAVLYGGRAAESLIFGAVTTGAQDDIAKATDIARSMVVQYGMVPELGQVAYERRQQSFLEQMTGQPQKDFADATAERIDAAVKAILDDAFDRARAILEHNRPTLEAAAAELLDRETLEQDDLDRVLEGVALPSGIEARPGVPRAAE
ncbi:MAG: ATP-dependent zinc metalloprotease FtsH [Azospirillaceae bacterium]